MDIVSILDRLPEIQKKYINKDLFLEAVILVNECDYELSLINMKTEDNPNLRRYCILVMRYI